MRRESRKQQIAPMRKKNDANKRRRRFAAEVAESIGAPARIIPPSRGVPGTSPRSSCCRIPSRTKYSYLPLAASSFARAVLRRTCREMSAR
eukprot:scaffold73755_cov33-Tisochrysis_lutea.AAC.1